MHGMYSKNMSVSCLQCSSVRLLTSPVLKVSMRSANATSPLWLIIAPGGVSGARATVNISGSPARGDAKAIERPLLTGHHGGAVR